MGLTWFNCVGSSWCLAQRPKVARDWQIRTRGNGPGLGRLCALHGKFRPRLVERGGYGVLLSAATRVA
jgi:hypothetical protein